MTLQQIVSKKIKTKQIPNLKVGQVMKSLQNDLPLTVHFNSLVEKFKLVKACRDLRIEYQCSSRVAKQVIERLLAA